MKFGVDFLYTEKLSSKRELRENPLVGNRTSRRDVNFCHHFLHFMADFDEIRCGRSRLHAVERLRVS